MPPPPPRPPPKPLRQTTLQPKLKLCELKLDAPEVKAEAVAPPLTLENAVQRFIFVPAEQFEATGIGGWVARIQKVTKNRYQTTEIMFKDADGKQSKQYFKLEHLIANFKPLS